MAFVLALLAMARPVARITLPADYMTLVMAMDVSRSMLATVEKMVGHIRDSVDLKFNAPVGRVH